MPVYECPTCGRRIEVGVREEAPYRPFCSRRCQLIDLGAWLEGRFVISRPLTEEDLEQWGGSIPASAEDSEAPDRESA